MKDNNKDVAVQNKKQSALNTEKNIRDIRRKERQVWKRIGQYCPNPECDYIVKDFVELEEEAEKGREIKKLKDEFIKKHDQLNKLAVQIKELENE